ncbi:hypothetical protein DFS34DRAFT_611072 [Phlyctochytrium arcticum]|nr:hypothetical protein DFS34DRAFT_611072 [Phlyctochytrium arcticum]
MIAQLVSLEQLGENAEVEANNVVADTIGRGAPSQALAALQDNRGYPALQNHFAANIIEAKGKGRALEQVELHLDDTHLLPRKRRTEDAESILPVATQEKRQRLEPVALGDSIDSEEVDLREDKVYTVDDALKWARGTEQMRSYILTAIDYTKQPDLRLQQFSRHMLRLIRACGVIESTVLAQMMDIPQYLSKKIMTRYDASMLYPVFQDNPEALSVLRSLTSDGMLVNFAAFYYRLGLRTRPPKSLMTNASIITLIETALKIPMGATELDEEDIRSVWAAATRAALPAVGQTGIGVSLEFAHTAQSDGDTNNVTKSDITVFIANDINDIGACVIEVDKVESGQKGRVHKDRVKVAGEIVQQLKSLIAACTLSTEERAEIEVFSGLVSRWTIQFHAIKVVAIGSRLWYVKYTDQKFSIGPNAKGVKGMLEYGEYLRQKILPACEKIQSVLARTQGPSLTALLAQLPDVSKDQLKSRTSRAPITPARARKHRRDK